MIYVVAVEGLLAQLEHVQLQIRDGRLSFRDRVSEKWELREEIRTVNSFFRIPLALQYAQLFLGTIKCFAAWLGSWRSGFGILYTLTIPIACFIKAYVEVKKLPSLYRVASTSKFRCENRHML